VNAAEREALATAIVDGNSYMTLATADAAGRPWATPVWYAPASYREYRARASEQFVLSPEDERLPLVLA
jgi:hypothetical protein